MSSQQLTMSRAQRWAYGGGDFGINVFWNMTNLFAMFYYTDVVGLANSVAGGVIFGAMLWDAITDPLIGLLAQRTRSRWGTYRPWLLLGAVPLGLSFSLMFYPPAADIAALTLWALASQIVFRSFYTVVGVPYASLSASLTQNPDERSQLAVARMLFATAAGVLVAALTRDGALWLGDGDLVAGFRAIAAVYAVIGVAAIVLCALLTRELHTSGSDSVTHRPSMREVLHMLRYNRYFWIAFVVILVGMAGATVSGKAVLYYLKYNLQAEHLTGLALLSVALTVMLFVPVWGRLSRTLDKRRVWMCGAAINVLAGVLLYLNPVQSAGPVIFLLMIGATGSAANYVSVWSTLPDTVEYGQWRTGVRAESILFGVVAFAQKLSLGIATLVSGLLLDAFGYVANQDQSEQALSGLKLMVSAVPGTAAFICFILIYHYRLDQREHARIMADLRQRSEGPVRDNGNNND